MIASNMTLAGMRRGMELMGAIFVKQDFDKIYFEVPKGCEIDDSEKLKLAAQVFNGYDIKLFVKRYK